MGRCLLNLSIWRGPDIEAADTKGSGSSIPEALRVGGGGWGLRALQQRYYSCGSRCTLSCGSTL